MICKQIFFEDNFYTSQSSFICTQLKGFKYFYQTLIVLFAIVKNGFQPSK